MVMFIYNGKNFMYNLNKSNKDTLIVDNNNDYGNMENLSKPKNNLYSKSDKQMKQEQFVNEYAVMKGWNVHSLTTEQMLEITQHPKYKNPFQINS
jgi:hypothetical protein